MTPDREIVALHPAEPIGPYAFEVHHRIRRDEQDDYARTGRQVVTFPPGATVERVLIPIVNDGVREPTETFTVHLAQPQNGVAGAVTTTRVTLYDDD